MDIKSARSILLQNSEFKKSYSKKDLKFEIAKMVIEARIFKKITQAKLAEMIGSTQSSVARVENGGVLPSLAFLEKIATALNTRLSPPQFEFMLSRTVFNLTTVDVDDKKTIKKLEKIKCENNYNCEYTWQGSVN